MQTFSVIMPDGTQIDNIPEGTTKEEVMVRYQRMNSPTTLTAAQASMQIPSIEGQMTGNRTNSTDYNAGNVFNKHFNDVVGERVGLDPENYQSVKKYAGPLTPLVDAAAGVFDTAGGATVGGLMAGPQLAADAGVMSDQSAKRLGRDFVGAAEDLAMRTGAANLMPGMYPRMANLAKTRQRNPLMAENARVLESVGAKPSVALTTEDQGVRALAAGTQRTPISGLPLQKSYDDAVEAVGNRAQELSGKLGQVNDDVGIGDMVRGGLNRYASDPTKGYDIKSPSRLTSAKSKAEGLYDAAGIDEAATIRPLNTVNTINPVVSKYSDDVFARVFKNTRMGKIAERMQNGEPVSYADLKQLRRDVYKLKKNPMGTADIDARDINNLYAGITGDLEEIAKSQGKLKEFRRAEKFWSKSQDRINAMLKKYAGDNLSDEAIYGRIERGLKEGSMGDIKSLQTLRRSLTDKEWGDISATVYNRLGLKNGEFNANQFSTNFSKLSPQGRKLLTSHMPGMEQAFEDLQKATKLLQRYDQSRPTGSFSTNLSLGTIGLPAIESMARGGSLPWISLMAWGAAGVTSSMMSSRRFVKLLTRSKKIEADRLSGKNVTLQAQSLNRDLYLLSASNDIAASDVERLLSTFGPERAAAEAENEDQGEYN